MFEFLEKSLIIDEYDYENLMKNQVEPYLEKKRKEGFITASDGAKLHYEAYEKKLSRGNIIILHGFTESAEKFREMTYYFRKSGYSVFVPDLRDHGKSAHSSVKTERIETESFEMYSEDLKLLTEKVIRPFAPEKKTYIYSHSLGSTVALLYMISNPYDIEKAVLSSPMICGNMGMPVPVASAAARLICGIGGKKISAPGRCVFRREMTVGGSDATSKARFEYYHKKRKLQPLYQTSGPSFSWVRASVEAKDKLLDEDNVSRIRTKLLVMKPEEDKQLLEQYTDRFIKLTGAEVKNVRNSKHEIFMSGNKVMEWYISEILEFFRED